MAADEDGFSFPNTKVSKARTPATPFINGRDRMRKQNCHFSKTDPFNFSTQKRYANLICVAAFAAVDSHAAVF